MELRNDITPHAAVIIGVLQGGTAQWYNPEATTHYVKGWLTPVDGRQAIHAMLNTHSGWTWRLKPPNTVRWAPVLQMAGGTEVILSFRTSKADACNRDNFRAADERWSQYDKLVRVLRVEYDDEGNVSSTFEEPA